MTRKAIGNALRMEILVRDNFRCTYCGNNVEGGAVLQVDHIVPVKQGGTNDVYNLTTCCRDCNMGKFDKKIDDLESMRLENATSKLEQLENVEKARSETLERARDIVKLKSSLSSVSVETQAFIEHIHGIDYNNSPYIKKYNTIIKREGLENVLEMIQSVNFERMSPGYLEGIIKNKKLEKEFGLAFKIYEHIHFQFIRNLNMKYPLKDNKKREFIEGLHNFLIHCIEGGEIEGFGHNKVIKNLEVEFMTTIKSIISFAKKHGKYDICEIIIEELFNNVGIYIVNNIVEVYIYDSYVPDILLRSLCYIYGHNTAILEKHSLKLPKEIKLNQSLYIDHLDFFEKDGVTFVGR